VRYTQLCFRVTNFYAAGEAGSGRTSLGLRCRKKRKKQSACGTAGTGPMSFIRAAVFGGRRENELLQGAVLKLRIYSEAGRAVKPTGIAAENDLNGKELGGKRLVVALPQKGEGGGILKRYGKRHETNVIVRYS